jgi:hypothetical protein
VAIAAAGLVAAAVLIAAYAVGRSTVAPTSPDPAASLPPATEEAMGYPPGYPPPQPTGEPTPTLDARSVTLASSPYAEILTTLQRELDGVDTAALAAHGPVTDTGSSPLTAVEAGMIEGGIALSKEDVRRILDAFYAAGSKPRIDGYFVQTFEGSPPESACIGVVTRGWAGTVASPPEPTLPPGAEPYGQAWPEDFPDGWWGWQLCTPDGSDWSWDEWICFGEEAPGATEDETRADLRTWREYTWWNVGDKPSSYDGDYWDSWEEPTYYVLEEPTT